MDLQFDNLLNYVKEYYLTVGKEVDDMIYNILSIPDCHWGSIDPVEQCKSLEFILEFIKQSEKSGIHIDLLVMAGDYFDSKLPLNSREAILSIQWFHELLDVCLENNTRVRLFQGTLDHDNDQLNAFKSLENMTNQERPDLYGEDLPPFFRLFLKTTSEETLPGLKCIYCPDETVETSEYEELYLNQMLSMHDIGFFHGTFDVVYGSLVEYNPSLMQKKNVIFRYSLWNKLIYGPMISGHWHDGKQYDHLYYTGSPFRYKFNEDEPKGMSFISYNTEDHSYFYQKIRNPFERQYLTYEVYSNLYKEKGDYRRIIDQIQTDIKKWNEPPASYATIKIRILVYIIDDKPENDVFISALRQQFMNQSNVKIVIKNKLKDKIKKEESRRNHEREKKYNFIYDKEKSTPTVIQSFIQENNPEVEIPLEFIEKKTSAYIKDFNGKK